MPHVRVTASISAHTAAPDGGEAAPSSDSGRNGGGGRAGAVLGAGSSGGGVGGVVVMQSALAVHTQSAPSLLRTHSDPFRVMGEEKKVLLMPTKKKKLALLFLDYC